MRIKHNRKHFTCDLVNPNQPPPHSAIRILCYDKTDSIELVKEWTSDANKGRFSPNTCDASCTAGLQGRVLAKSMAAAILCLLLQYPLRETLFFCNTLYSLKCFTLDHQNFRKTKRFSLFTG